MTTMDYGLSDYGLVAKNIHVIHFYILHLLFYILHYNNDFHLNSTD